MTAEEHGELVDREYNAALRRAGIGGNLEWNIAALSVDRAARNHARVPFASYPLHSVVCARLIGDYTVSAVETMDRNELGALLVAAGLGSPVEHALVSLLALNGLRVSEATGANIENLGVERGHRTLVVTRKGGKVVTIPLAPRTARAIDLAVEERVEGPIFSGPDEQRLDRHGARPGRPPSGQPRRDHQAGRAAHLAARVHHRRPRRRRATP
jgi:integrase